MAEKLQITIIGLGMIGASAGLALRRYQEKVYVVGHDPDPERTGRAKQMGAVDKTEWNLINAVKKADRVLLALSAGAVRDTLEVIADDLKPGCILVDTASTKASVLQWATKLLPKNVHFVGGHPIVLAENMETIHAKADLFDNKLFCLMPNAQAEESGLRLAIDLVQALGAQAFFLDAEEHDGMTAAVEHLPLVLAGALMSITNASPSWSDMRKLAGSQFYSGTWVAQTDAKAAAGECIANREQVTHWIDRMIAELGEWRAQIAAGETEGLTKDFETGLSATSAWVRAHAQGVWEEQPPMSDLPTSGGYMRQMIGLGGLGRQSGKSKR